MIRRSIHLAATLCLLVCGKVTADPRADQARNDAGPKSAESEFGRLIARLFELKLNQAAGVGAFSPDGRFFAAAGQDDNRVIVWDATNGKQRGSFAGGEGWIRRLDFSHDGKVLEVNSIVWHNIGGTVVNPQRRLELVIRLWNVDENQEVFKAHGYPDYDQPESWAIAFSPDRRIVAQARAKEIRLTQVRTGNSLRTIEASTSKVRALAFSADGKALAATDSESKVVLWDIASGNVLSELKLSPEEIKDVSLSADGKLLVTTLDKQNVQRIWDVVTRTKLLETNPTVSGHQVPASHSSWGPLSPDRKHIAFGFGGPCRVWFALQQVGQQSAEFLIGGQIQPPKFSPDSKILVMPFASDRPVFLAWELQAKRNWKEMLDDSRRIQGDTSVAHPCLWLALPGMAPSEAYRLESSLIFAADGKAFALLGENDIRLFRGLSLSELATFSNRNQQSFSTIVFSTNGKSVVTTGPHETITVWDREKGKPLFRLRGAKGQEYSITFSPDDALLAAGCADGKVRLWSAVTGNELGTRDHGTAVYSLRFTGDGATLIVHGNHDSTYWNVSNGKKLDKPQHEDPR